MINKIEGGGRSNKTSSFFKIQSFQIYCIFRGSSISSTHPSVCTGWPVQKSLTFSFTFSRLGTQPVHHYNLLAFSRSQVWREFQQANQSWVLEHPQFCPSSTQNFPKCSKMALRAVLLVKKGSTSWRKSVLTFGVS